MELAFLTTGFEDVKLVVEGQNNINHRFGLGLEQKSLITFSDSRSLIYSHDSTHTIIKTDLTVKHERSLTMESQSDSKFEFNHHTFPLVIAAATEDPNNLVRTGKTVTFLQIDPRNKRQLLIGYDDGMAEILDSNNFQSVVFSTE